MVQKQLLRVLTGIILLVAGMITIMAGLLISLFALDGSWLLLSLLGLGIVIGGVLLVIKELHTALGYAKRHIPKTKPGQRPVKHIKSE